MSIVSGNFFNPNRNVGQVYDGPPPDKGPFEGPYPADGQAKRIKLGVTAAQLRGADKAILDEQRISGMGMRPGDPSIETTQYRQNKGMAVPMRPQAYKEQSADPRDGLASFFAAGSKFRERDAYMQNHVSVSGVPGVVHMAVLDAEGNKIPYAPFSWGGRSYHCDADGKFTILERQYFQNTISAENERTKYVTQLISLVVGAPASNVIAMFGMDFYKALGPTNAEFSIRIYAQYLFQAGFSPQIINQKTQVFRLYADADASPEVMANYGDNDPHWSRAFTKLSSLIEHHPSAILFDSGTVDPTADSGTLEGKRDVTIPMEKTDLGQVEAKLDNVVSAAVEVKAPAPPAAEG